MGLLNTDNRCRNSITVGINRYLYQVLFYSGGRRLHSPPYALHRKSLSLLTWTPTSVHLLLPLPQRHSSNALNNRLRYYHGPMAYRKQAMLWCLHDSLGGQSSFLGRPRSLTPTLHSTWSCNVGCPLTRRTSCSSVDVLTSTLRTCNA
jgi:hypothetical protein